MISSESSSNVPLLIKSVRGHELDRPPVWCMRQAGRYLPEYQALRKSHSFNELAETPSLACEVTMQPLRRFKELDAAILFADILTPSRALGFDFEFEPGPSLRNPILSPDQINSLERLSVEDAVPFVFRTLEDLRNTLESEKRDQRTTDERRALLGFAASPWTLACYLIDQGIYKQHLGTKIFARKYPEAFAHLCSQISALTTEYLLKMLSSGADAVQIFDTWGILLAPAEYYEFSGRWISPIIDAVQNAGGTVILYLQGDTSLIKEAIKLSPDVMSIDWKTPMTSLEAVIPAKMALQGNVDSTLLFSSTQEIQSQTRGTYSSLSRRSRIIANLGHGLLPATPIEGVKSYLSAVHTAWHN